MSTITRERIAELANFKPSGANSVNSATREEWQELARIALASLEAKSRKLFTCSGCGAEGLDEPLESKCHCNEDGAHWVESVVYTAPPAPVSVPECFKRLLHHAYGMTMGHDWNKGTMAGHHREKLCRAVDECRAAMLQAADGTLTNEVTIPATQFKKVADLYEMQFDDGRTCAFHTDGAKAVQWLLACDGNKVQEFVKLQRYQEALSGNSPVIPDGWVLVPVEPTMAMLDEFDSIIDYGAEDSKEAWSRLIATVPQQEVKP
jgi:hypothetical protein